MQEMRLSWDRLRVFSFLWGIAIIIHTMAFPYNIVATPLSWVMVIVAALLVFSSNSLLLLFALSIIQIIEFSIRVPNVPNHWLLSSLMSLNILICLLSALSRKGEVNREDLFDRIAVAGRLLVIVVFWAATFHKLNWDFLNPVVSCAVSLYVHVAELYYLPQNDLVSWLAIYGTYLIEFLIPLLLIIPRSRNWGILLGMFFHLFLGMRDVYDFGAILYALYFLFVSRVFVETFFKTHGEKLARLKHLTWVAQGLFCLALLIPFRWIFTAQLTAEYFAPLWIIVALVAIYLVMTTFRQEEPQNELVFTHLASARFSFTLILLFCLVNSLSPYVGLKTNLAFDMYSNLRVENKQSNHFLISADWQIFPYTQDIALFIESNDPWLQLYISESWGISRHELGRFIQNRPQYRTHVLYQGQEYQLPEDSAAFEPIHPLLLWLLSFEPIEQGESVPCSW